MSENNELTTKPIPGLIAKLAIPASIGMFFNTMYNVVDTYFSGLISTEAIAALSLSFPVFFVILSIGFGISTGATALIANALGTPPDDIIKRIHDAGVKVGALCYSACRAGFQRTGLSCERPCPSGWPWS